MSKGYSNRIIHLPFPHLTDDPDDKVWVSIRNPRLMPPGELRPRDMALDVDGKPIDEDDGWRATYEIVTKLVIGWRVYDATVMEIDESTGEALDQPLLPSKATPELVAKLPMEIINRISAEMAESANPK